MRDFQGVLEQIEEFLCGLHRLCISLSRTVFASRDCTTQHLIVALSRSTTGYGLCFLRA